MDDRNSKINGFGIGELGGVPESTPLDDEAARQIIRRAAKPAPGGYTVQTDDHEIEFGTRDEALTYARALPPGMSASIFGEGYSIGDLPPMGVFTLLHWREKVTDTPHWECQECGSVNVSGGRCHECGEQDMLVQRDYRFAYHTEVRHQSGIWLWNGRVVQADKFVYDSWRGATGPVQELHYDGSWGRWVFRVDEEWFNLDDVEIEVPA